jgi:hypothetical protein
MLISFYSVNYSLYDIVRIFITVTINRSYGSVFIFFGTDNDYS